MSTTFQETIPPIDHIIYRGEGPEPDRPISPEEAWSIRDGWSLDGTTIYEPGTTIWNGEKSERRIHRVAVIVTKDYINGLNAEAEAQGKEPVYITWAEVPILKRDPPLRKIVRFLTRHS